MKVFLPLMGEKFVADVDYDVTSYGSPAHMGSLSYSGDPGDPPEFEINSITLRRDVPGSAEFEATGALFDCLVDNEHIVDAICDAIVCDGPPEFDDNYF